MLHLDIKGVHSLIASNPNLSVFYKWILTHSTSLALPYHNLHHTFCMVQLVWQIWKESQTNNRYEFKLTDDNLYILIVSALFHDFSHSGGLHSDSINVSNAIAGMKRCIDECTEYSQEQQELKKKCASVIKATEYPYVIPDNELDLLQRIIRECDILVSFYDDMFFQNIIGLSAELHATDITQFVMDELNFIMDASKKFQLEFSTEILNKYSNELVQEMTAFIESIKTQSA